MNRPIVEFTVIPTRQGGSYPMDVVDTSNGAGATKFNTVESTFNKFTDKIKPAAHPKQAGTGVDV